MKLSITAGLPVNEQKTSLYQNVGFLLLRFFVGLALCTVFEKFLPREGIWGPPAWFINDTANMGFPSPALFAWAAVLIEFFGGFLLMVGLFTRTAALLNALVTFTATFIYHHGDISGSGLLSFFFMIMCTCIALIGPGQFSIDHFIAKKLPKKGIKMAVVVLALMSFKGTAGQLHSTRLSFCHSAAAADFTPVQFYLKNNSLLPKKATFIIYQPQQKGNNTLVKWLLPFQKLRLVLPAESRIYLARPSQVERVMQGRSIEADQPFVIVTKKINKATLPLNGLKEKSPGNNS